MFGLSFFIFLVSLLAVFKAPAKPLWFIAIGATECGHYLAIVAMGLAYASWRQYRRRNAAACLALAAVILFLSPVARAAFLAQGLPEQFAASFGNAFPRQAVNAAPRSEPLNVSALFIGVGSPPVRVTSRVYETVHGQRLSLDLYSPMHLDQPLPCVIVVHGGSWQGGDRSDLSDLNRYLAARGYLVASMDYRLAPGAVFPAQKDDVFAAIAFLKNHAKEIGLDPEHFVLLGRSAGGQIAMSAAYAEKDAAIKGIIAFYTPNDLMWAYVIPANPLIINSQKVIETYLGGKPSQIPEAYESASPLHFVSHKTPPTLMIHGVRDELVWAKHDDRLSQRLAQAGRPFFYLRLPWATHGCDANFSGPSGQLSTYVIERFLAAVMPASREERLAMTAKKQAHV